MNTATGMVRICAATETDIEKILRLQEKNLARNLTAEQIASQGFVTVVNTLDHLQRMNAAEPIVIAKSGDAVVGYAFPMPVEFGREVAALQPFIEKFSEVAYNGKVLSDYRHAIMGQICIAEGFRGIGLFDKLYAQLKSQFKGRYDLIITEVDKANPRSLRAHLRIGHHIVHEYESHGAVWIITVLSVD